MRFYFEKFSLICFCIKKYKKSLRRRSNPFKCNVDLKALLAIAKFEITTFDLQSLKEQLSNLVNTFKFNWNMVAFCLISFHKQQRKNFEITKFCNVKNNIMFSSNIKTWLLQFNCMTSFMGRPQRYMNTTSS